MASSSQSQDNVACLEFDICLSIAAKDSFVYLSSVVKNEKTDERNRIAAAIAILNFCLSAGHKTQNTYYN